MDNVELLRILEKIDSLDRLTDAKFVTQRTMMDANANQVKIALDSSEKAIIKAEIATDKRFHAMNEFRKALTELSTTMSTRREMEASVGELKHNISQLNEQTAELRSRLDVGPAGLSSLQNQYSTMQGLTRGSEITIGKIYAGIGAVGAILAIVVVLVNGVFN